MIIPKGNFNTSLRSLPFTATLSKQEMVVTFSDGYIFNCYDLSGNEFVDTSGDRTFNFTEGSRYHLLVGRSFQFEYGDWFYLDAKSQVQFSSIYKVSKSDRDEGIGHFGRERPVLIWKGPEDEISFGEQILTENVFIQNFEDAQAKGFSIVDGEYEQSGYNKILSPAFVLFPQVNFYKFIPQTKEFIEYDDGSKEETPEKEFVLKIHVEATVSDEDPINGANLSFIKTFEVKSVELEYREDDYEDSKIKLNTETPIGGIYEGDYYLPITSQNGNIVITFLPVTKERIIVEPAFETQVRGARYYKNGVLASSLNVSSYEGEDGYFKRIDRRRVFNKYTINEGDQTVSGPTDYVITTAYYTEGEENISETEPVIIQEEQKDELQPNEYLSMSPKEDEITPVGGEISNKAYASCSSRAVENPFTAINSWSGDGTPVLSGAGRSGRQDKTSPFVIHAERRFKLLGILSSTTDIDNKEELPSQFQHWSGILYTDGSDESLSGEGELKLDTRDLIYTNDKFITIPLKDEDDVYGKEYIFSECQAQIESGGQSYLYADYTLFAWKDYQILEMTANEDSVV